MDGPYRSAGAPSGLTCPRCATGSLWRRAIGYVSVAECQTCEGVWVARETLDVILEDIGLYQEVRTIYRSGPRRMESGGPFYRKCPACTEVMNRRLYAPDAKVIVDVCRAHGTWFDARELPAVIAFVEDGGLAASQRKEDERKAMARAQAAIILATQQQPRRRSNRLAQAIGGLFLWMLRWR